MDKDIRAHVIERTMSPLGWHNVGVAYLDAAEELVASKIRPNFEAPIRSLFAHAWELSLKACLRRQGMDAENVRKQFGHDLIKLWDAVDRPRFGHLSLRDELRFFIESLAFQHRNRLYAYPIRGFKQEHSLDYVRATSSRLRLPRVLALETFGSP